MSAHVVLAAYVPNRGEIRKMEVKKETKHVIGSLFRGENAAYIFLMPWIVGILVFFAYPIVSSVQLSFSKIATLFNYKLQYVGLDNFKVILFQDVKFIPALLQSLRQTAIFLPVIVILSMILAIILNSNIKAKGLFRSLYFLPVILGTGYVIQQLLGQDSGTATQTISRGLEIPPVLTNMFDSGALDIIKVIFDNITMILWRCGVQILIFLSGLQAISPALYESARVDGATEWEMYWKITLPMLAPVTVMNIIYTIVVSFTDLSNPVISYMLEYSKDLRGAGAATAMAWMYLVMVLIIVMVVMLFARKSTDSVYKR